LPRSGAFASFAVFGLFTSVAAGFVAVTLHHPSRALAGLIVFVVFGVAAAVQSLTTRLSIGARRGLGLLAQAAVGSVVALAAPAQRGEALAGPFLLAYLGLTVPVIAIGVATLYFATVPVMTWFAGILLVLLASVALLARRGRAAHLGQI
jgi:hypothetical protein